MSWGVYFSLYVDICLRDADEETLANDYRQAVAYEGENYNILSQTRE